MDALYPVSVSVLMGPLHPYRGQAGRGGGCLDQPGKGFLGGAALRHLPGNKCR